MNACFLQCLRRTTLPRLSLGLAAMLTGTLVGAAESTDAPPEAAWRAARDGLGGLVSAALADQPERYGFPADVAVEELRLDTPWRQYALPPDAVLNVAPSLSSIEETLQATDTWLFPIVRGDSPCALLAVNYSGEEWRAAALGYVGLSRELARVRAQWPAKGGYHARLVSSFQARRHLFTVPEAGAPNLTLLRTSPAPTQSIFDYRRLDAPAATLQTLQAEVQANLHAFPAGGPAP